MLRKNEFFGVIYLTTNLVNGKIYIGKYRGNDSNYLGSGLLLKRAIRKYGKENFKRKILCICFSKKELNFAEIYLIKKYQACKLGYNIAKGGNGGDIISNHPNKKLIIKRCANKRKGQKRSNKTRQKMKAVALLKGTWNKGLTKETDKRLFQASINRKGKGLGFRKKGGTSWLRGLTKETDERVAKISKRMIGNKYGSISCSENKKRKISKANTGNIAWNKGLTEETNSSIANMSKKYINTIWITNEINNKRINKYETIPNG